MYNPYGNIRGGVQEGEPLGMVYLDVGLTSNNVSVDVSLYSMLRLSSDNTTAANRTFTITNGIVIGHMLTLVFMSGASTTCKLTNTNPNVALSADFTPTLDGTLVLVWQGTYWVELCRSVNT